MGEYNEIFLNYTIKVQYSSQEKMSLILIRDLIGLRQSMANGRMKYDWFDTSKEDREKWEALCPPGEYRILPSEVLSGVVPQELYSQYNSVFIMASGTASGNIYFMANGNRVDFPDNAVDQMPFGLAFIGDDPVPSGCLIQHGDWEGRTTEPPQEFWGLIIASGIHSHYPLSEMPEESAGKITNLKIDSQDAAFGKLVDSLKDQVGE